MIEFLPRYTDAREEADRIINRLVENDVRALPDDFLTSHQSTLSRYRGTRGPVVETDEYSSAEACARMVITKLNKERNPMFRTHTPRLKGKVIIVAKKKTPHRSLQKQAVAHQCVKSRIVS